MRVCRFQLPGAGPQLGLIRSEGGAATVYRLTPLHPAVYSLNELIGAAAATGRTPLGLLRELLGGEGLPALAGLERFDFAFLDRPPVAGAPHLLPPLVAPEVWAAGVTYRRSLEAREEESSSATVYDKVYEAARPELFLKATGARVVGPNDWVGLRSDSSWQVPEPELGLVLGGAGDVIGYTIGNDMSSRDIEGENPLYLPQAKIFRHSCAIGPAVLLVDPAEAEAPRPRAISLRISRGGVQVFEGSTSTGALKRAYRELVSYLYRDNEVWPGTVLLTGTGIVPGAEFTLRDGDRIEIEIEGIGALLNVARAIPER